MFACVLRAFVELPLDAMDDVVGELQFLLDDGQLPPLELTHLEFTVCGIGAFELLALLALPVSHFVRIIIITRVIRAGLREGFIKERTSFGVWMVFRIILILGCAIV